MLATESEIEAFECGVDFFALEITDRENLSHGTIADLLGEYFDDMDGADFEEIVRVIIAGESVGIEVESYRRRKVSNPQNYADRALDGILGRLDDEYAGDDSNDPTPAMKEAAKVFAEAIIAEYFVWTCERVGSILIDLTPYARETSDFAEIEARLRAVPTGDVP